MTKLPLAAAMAAYVFSSPAGALPLLPAMDQDSTEPLISGIVQDRQLGVDAAYALRRRYDPLMFGQQLAAVPVTTFTPPRQDPPPIAVPSFSANATSEAARGPAKSLATPPLTFHGITIYGVIDTAIAYQSHGVALNGDYPTGLEYVVSKNSGRSRVSLAPNALTQSKTGLRGHEDVSGDLAVVFQVEAQFVPTSGKLVDGLKAVVDNNGRSLGRQSANGDSSKAGQAFAGMAYAGLSSRRFGTITVGRQLSLILDDILTYDPMVVSHAFSLIGYQGAAQAGASTEDARLDRSVKYALRHGNGRLVAMYQFGNANSPATRAYGVDVGRDFPGGSVDVVYSHINDSISASPLSAAQFEVAPSRSLAASISDNDAVGAFGKYALSRAVIFAGYELILYRNPNRPIEPGARTLGGYLLSFVNNAAYPKTRRLSYAWIGARYTLASRLVVTGAYYRSAQNSYGVHECSSSSSPQCSGHLDAVSALLDYKAANRVDLYSGAMRSSVARGLRSGFAHASSVDPMIGVRLTF